MTISVISTELKTAECIAERYVSIITEIGHMSERGESVGNLALLAVKDCLSAMQSTGMATQMTQRILAIRIKNELDTADYALKKFRLILELAYVDVLSFS